MVFLGIDATQEQLVTAAAAVTGVSALLTYRYGGHLYALEKWMLFVGYVWLFTLVPPIAAVVGSAVLWDFADRGFRGRPQDGFVFKIAELANSLTHRVNSKISKNPADAFVVNTLALVGGAVPALFFYNFYRSYVLGYGFDLAWCYTYHVLRIGPYFMSFAYVYTMCHKEGHSRLGLWSPWFNPLLKNVFNWWVGLFYGVMPSSFAYGHSINHHKYNNGPCDVVSTSDKPRDSAVNFIGYIPRFGLYTTNISTIQQFYSEGNTWVAAKMAFGSAWYLAFFCTFFYFDREFALGYILFPVLEQTTLLSCINWCWHAFLNRDDPECNFVGSVTIFNGPINVLQEDYHVVHHQYPGVHHTKHERLYEKHLLKGEYAEKQATMFTDTHVFELFFLIILGEYDKMAEHFVDLNNKLSHEEKKEVIKHRLRTCWWGPRTNVTCKLEGKEIGNEMDVLDKDGRYIVRDDADVRL